MGKFEAAGNRIGKLVEEKNAAYGNSFVTCAQALDLLYPDGVKPSQYRDMLALVRIWDKMQRIATDRDFQGESPFGDIAGYGLLGLVAVEEERDERP
jgi:hypothetical protein